MSLLPMKELGEAFAGISERKSDSYIYSPSYYLLTGREGTSLYSRNGAYLVVCKHPHIPERLMVFPEINGDGTLTLKVLNSLVPPKNGIQLARYTDIDFQRIQDASQKTTGHKSLLFTQIDETIMDWKFPVHILDTLKTSELKGGIYDKLRNKFNKASNHLEIKLLKDPDSLKTMRASLHMWLGMMIYNDKENGHSLTAFYDALFKLIENDPDSFGGFTVTCNGEPAGFTIWDKPTFGIANGLASLGRYSVKGMAEFQMITACRILNEQGIKYYNIGGSETQGLNKHKLEYKPDISIPIYSYEVKDNSLDDVHFCPLI